jgi:alkanesulfonate monooxygenase SsuD/methylene tetrahydromethanopterin reductase-like flavin-dependent oxidoreductase (luciferase family)
VVEWGDGWIPVVASADEFADGISKIKAMAREAGRDPGALDFTVFGIEGQWQTKAEIQEFAKAGADRVVVWLGNDDLNGTLREMERLAKALIS